MTRIGIVEDDLNEMADLEGKVESYFDSRKIPCSIHTFDKPLEFMDKFVQGDYDILFFDIEMPCCNGIELARSIRERDKDVFLIFCTRMSNMALDGYSVRAYDFLVKPVKKECIDRLLDELVSMTKPKEETITIKMGNDVTKKLKIGDIVHVEVASHLLLIELYPNEILELWMPLSKIESLLPTTNFMRISNSALINFDYVEEIRRDEIIVNGKPMKLSRSKRKEFFNRFSEYIGR